MHDNHAVLKLNKRIYTVVAFALCSVTRLYGQTSVDDRLRAFLERPKLLVVDYKNLPIVIESIQPNNTAGLTREMVKTRTELRLRSVGLKPIDATGADHYLYVTINVVGASFSVGVEFYRHAEWQLPDGTKGDGDVHTWGNGETGTHGRDPAFVLNSLDEVLDVFMNAYLKANQEK